MWVLTGGPWGSTGNDTSVSLVEIVADEIVAENKRLTFSRYACYHQTPESKSKKKRKQRETLLCVHPFTREHSHWALTPCRDVDILHEE